MKLRRSLAERWRRWHGWVLPAALLALVPKCALCLLAYAGLGGAFIGAGPELCGGSASSFDSWLVLSGGILAGVTLAAHFWRNRPRRQST